MVEFLEKDLPIPGIGLAFIYCNHKANQAQNVKYFLGTITRQLVEQRQAIPKDVRTLHEKHRGKGTTPTREEYLALLQLLGKECSEIYIVIDALDECIDNKGESIWDDFLTQLMGSVSNLHLLCTSREIDDIAFFINSYHPCTAVDDYTLIYQILLRNRSSPWFNIIDSHGMLYFREFERPNSVHDP